MLPLVFLSHVPWVYLIWSPEPMYEPSSAMPDTQSAVEHYTTHNFLECHQDADHARIQNRRWSVLGIIHSLHVVSVLLKFQIQPDVASE